jgi:galactose mutarotase-like enzyme
LGFGVRLSAGAWELEVRPERGGRIASLRLRAEELLEQGIGVDEPAAAEFVEGGAWGWDEMVPNVRASGGLPDHGEAWRLPWQVLEVGPESIVMRCRGHVVPWELERRIQLGEAVRLSYVYRNVGPVAHHAYWCAHPLFRFEDGMSIGVPGGEGLGSLAPGTSTKMFLAPGAVDRATLRWVSGTAIELAWDPVLTPYTGVWVCNGDLGGYRQVAVEPATGGRDGPDPAAPAPLLEPGGRLAWWLEVRDVG